MSSREHPWINVDPVHASLTGKSGDGWVFSDDITGNVLQFKTLETTMGEFFRSLKGNNRFIIISRNTGRIYDGKDNVDAVLALTNEQKEAGVTFVYPEKDIFRTIYYRRSIFHGIGEQDGILMLGRFLKVADYNKFITDILSLKRVG